MLTEHEASIVKGLLDRGDKQHDVAAFFSVNPGRVAEIKTGMRHLAVEPAAKKDLPSIAEVASGHALYRAKQALLRAKLGIEGALSYLADQESEHEARERVAARTAEIKRAAGRKGRGNA